MRRTLGGQRQDSGEVWDVATTEIPPDVGEAPECQWCPICRAARRMRESGPGLAGHLSGAGDAVATAVQDAFGALDSILARPGSGTDSRSSESQAGVPASDREAGPADGAPSRPDSLAAGHGPGGWKPGDRLATPGIVATDPWATATTLGEAGEDGTEGGQSAGPDGPGHGPRNRS